MDAEIQKAVIAGLDRAIRTETDGYHFYMMAAMATEDERGKQILAQLAEEELEHRRFLEGQRRSILESGQVDASLGMRRIASLTGDSPIFSSQLTRRAAEAHYEMSALSIGIQLELASQTYYREQADEARDPALKKIYADLAAWEQGHYEALLRQHDSLKEDYWAAAGFSPF
ncbi:MAG: ferritin family protein [Deltaproteobacteria bacterium]|nr:ferritin family protein [Deltaproteobacteria bacterium]